MKNSAVRNEKNEKMFICSDEETFCGIVIFAKTKKEAIKEYSMINGGLKSMNKALKNSYLVTNDFHESIKSLKEGMYKSEAFKK